MKALVYFVATDYVGSDRWNSPSAIWLHEDDVMRGVAWTPCLDCGGTGHYPVPWRGPGAALEDFDIGDDFCVRCKGQGLGPVMCG